MIPVELDVSNGDEGFIEVVKLSLVVRLQTKRHFLKRLQRQNLYMDRLVNAVVISVDV